MVGVFLSIFLSVVIFCPTVFIVFLKVLGTIRTANIGYYEE